LTYEKSIVRRFINQIELFSDCEKPVTEKVKVGIRGQVVIPKKLRKKLNIEHGVILEIEEAEEGLILKPVNPVAEMKGLGEGVFEDPVEYQRKLRKEWET
jgi:AbrB family looped-hinge helix DNA binding protein